MEAIYDYWDANQLIIRQGNIITHVKEIDEFWWEGNLGSSGERGIFPANYVKVSPIRYNLLIQFYHNVFK